MLLWQHYTTPIDLFFFLIIIIFQFLSYYCKWLDFKLLVVNSGVCVLFDLATSIIPEGGCQVGWEERRSGGKQCGKSITTPS